MISIKQKRDAINKKELLENCKEPFAVNYIIDDIKFSERIRKEDKKRKSLETIYVCMYMYG